MIGKIVRPLQADASPDPQVGTLPELPRKCGIDAEIVAVISQQVIPSVQHPVPFPGGRPCQVSADIDIIVKFTPENPFDRINIDGVELAGLRPDPIDAFQVSEFLRRKLSKPPDFVPDIGPCRNPVIIGISQDQLKYIGDPVFRCRIFGRPRIQIVEIIIHCGKISRIDQIGVALHMPLCQKLMGEGDRFSGGCGIPQGIGTCNAFQQVVFLGGKQ